jgi:CheY-like chemotaxis protein
VSSILIVYPERKPQRVVQRVLGACGYTVDVADDLARGEQLLEERRPGLVVVDGDALSGPALGDLLDRARTHGAATCVTLLDAASQEQARERARERGQECAHARIRALLALGTVDHLLVHPMPVLAEELALTAHKLARNDLFGAEKYLLWGTRFEDALLTRSGQRVALVAQLAAQLQARGLSARIASLARLVADELISNAVHNAPVDATGARPRRDLPRDQDLELDGRHAVQLRWGCDARYLATEVRESGGGAGMGLAIAYRSSDQLVFAIAPGTRTEIIALLDVRQPPTERAPASSYNVFVERS